MDYIEQVSAGMFDHASDSIDKAEEEHGEVNTSLPVETHEKEVEAGESVQEFADQGLESPTVEEKETELVDENPDAQYTRTTAFNAASGEVELETPEDFDKAETTKERLAELRSVNEELKRQGDKRRYVAAKSDAPSTAQLYKDDFGIYYYKAIEVDVRPSDIASFADVKAVVALDDDQKALKTIEFLSSMYADPLIDASTEKAATTWLERHLVLTDDDPGSNDTFSHEFKSRLADLIARAGSPEGEEGKAKQSVPDNAVSIDSRGEAPEGADVVEGPQGGLYYIPGGGEDEQETTMGFAGEMPWGEQTQDVASGIASDVAREAQSGGAYQSRDEQEVLDIAEENAREYAREQGIDEEMFVEEVRTQVEMEMDQPPAP